MPRRPVRQGDTKGSAGAPCLPQRQRLHDGLVKFSRMDPMSHHTLLVQASLRGWSVLVDGKPLTGSWSRTLAKEAAMEEALNILRAGPDNRAGGRRAGAAAGRPGTGRHCGFYNPLTKRSRSRGLCTEGEPRCRTLEAGSTFTFAAQSSC